MRRLPSLTKSQRRALLLVEWVLLLGIAGFSIWKWKVPSDSVPKEEIRREWFGTPAKPFVYAEKEREVETFPFDPNTADSTALFRLGLSPWQVRSIYRYRARLGRYHTPEDFKNVPHLTNEQWNRLSPYIHIAQEFRYVDSPRRSQKKPMEWEKIEERPVADSVAPADVAPRAEKLLPGQTVDVNTADTSQLKLIPGIASRRAARIVAYRKALGGFVAAEQAMEAVEMPDSVLQYMTLSPVEVAKIKVNRLSVQQLMKHPYLSFYQAKAIFEHRRNKGELHSLEELSGLEAFRPTDLDRLRPYLSFE